MDVAASVGMSKSMVSSVLGKKPYCCASSATRVRIETAARRLGYRPNLLARGLKNGRSRVIGFINDSVHHEVSAQEIVYLTNALLPLDYQVQVIYSRGEPCLRLAACNRLVDSGCDAIIVSGNLDFFEFTVPLPTFLINADLRGKDFAQTIFVDYRVGVEEGIACLQKYGHECIGMAVNYWQAFQQDQRKVAFAAFCQQAGISDSEAMTLIFHGYEEITAERMRQFFQQQPACTAFICSNDLVAMKLIRSLQQLGLSVPKDISVIGFDDNVAADFFIPSLSSIRQPTENVIREMVKLLSNVLDGKEQPVQHVVPCYLIKRDSIGPARKQRLFLSNKAIPDGSTTNRN